MKAPTHTIPAPVAAPAKVPISECIGQRVKCPQCGAPADVDHARGAMLRQQPISSQWWVLVRCTGQCGSRLEKIGTAVEVEAKPRPGPTLRPVGQVVSRFVVCPGEDCKAHARVAWTIDDGHVIDCPRCQRRRVGPETIVEMVA